MQRKSTSPAQAVGALNPESVAYWYLRLNGFLTLPGFVVHPDTGSDQGTDVDVIGVRFPFRSENLSRPMEDDLVFSRWSDRPLLVLTEVKKGRIAINGPWTNPEQLNLLRVIRAVGIVSESEEVALSLLKQGYYESPLVRVTMLAIGRKVGSDFPYPRVPQLLWEDILRFVHKRFHEYREPKSSHGGWDETGHALWDVYRMHRHRSASGEFAEAVMEKIERYEQTRRRKEGGLSG